MSTSSREYVVKEGIRFDKYDVRSNYMEFDVKGWEQFVAEQLSKEKQFVTEQLSKEIDRQILNELLSERRFEPEKITQRKLQDMVLTWRFQF